MKKGLLVIALIIIIVIIGFTLNSSSNEAGPEDQEEQEEKVEEADKREESLEDGEQAITSATASYVALKGWLSKPSEEVVGTTAEVTGHIVYNSETETLEEVSIEIDDQSFVTGADGRDKDVAKMFSDPGNISVKLALPTKMPEGNFSASLPLIVEVNGVEQTVPFSIKGSLGPNGATASGSADITFSQFGLDAPSIVGLYNVAEELTVEFAIETSAN